MNTSTILEVLLPILSIALLWLIKALVSLANAYAHQVRDETLRAFLLELVRAAEQMIPEPGSGEAKLAKVQSMVPHVPREYIEAAVKTMKEIESLSLLGGSE